MSDIGMHRSAHASATSWSGTPLGEMEGWSPGLRRAAAICLDWPTPALLTWGPQLRMLYNEGGARVLGDRHPGSRGQSAWDVLPDMWPDFGPVLQHILVTARSAVRSRAPLRISTADGPRLRYYSGVLVPLHEGTADADTPADGVFMVVADETAAVLAERRTGVVDAVEALGAGPAADVLRSAVEAVVSLEVARYAVAYVCDPTSEEPVRVAAAGSVATNAAAAPVLDLAVPSRHWPVREVMHGGDVVQVPPAPAGSVTARPFWDSAWLVPVRARGAAVGLIAVAFPDDVGAVTDDRAFVTRLGTALESVLG